MFARSLTGRLKADDPAAGYVGADAAPAGSALGGRFLQELRTEPERSCRPVLPGEGAGPLLSIRGSPSARAMCVTSVSDVVNPLLFRAGA